MNNLYRKIVKTRKPHECFACNRTFKKGSEMERQVNVDGGEIYQLYSCKTCQILMSEFSELFLYEGIFEYGCIPKSYDDEENPEELLKNLRSKN